MSYHLIVEIRQTEFQQAHLKRSDIKVPPLPCLFCGEPVPIPTLKDPGSAIIVKAEVVIGVIHRKCWENIRFKHIVDSCLKVGYFAEKEFAWLFIRGVTFLWWRIKSREVVGEFLLEELARARSSI